MSNQSDVPVVIVGAGPTGVMLAIELARRGVGVRILDKQPSRSQATRAIGIHARTLEVFHQIGIVEEFLEAGHRVTGFAVHTPARRSTRVRFGGLDSPYPFVLMLGQDRTQRILDQRLEQLGVTIERGVTVGRVDHDADGVEIMITRAGEQGSHTLFADWAVGCDGARSVVRRELGVPLDGDDYGQDWLMAEVNVQWPIGRNDFHVFSYSAAPMVAFPLPGDRWRVFLPQVPNRAGERRPPDMDEILRLAAGRGPASIVLTDPTLLSAFRCYRRSTKIMRVGRMVIAGDAAHIHSPAGGQGMNTGLHDAFNLGWKLALVAQRQSPPALLDTYQDERVPIAAGVLELTHHLVRLFTIASPRKRWLRDHLLPAVMAVPVAERGYIHRLAQLSHNYAGGPLTPQPPRDRHDPIAPGNRLPDVSGLQLGGKALSTLDLLGSTNHTLFVLAGEQPQAGDTEKAIARLARWGDIVQIILIRQHCGTRDPRAVSDPELRAHHRYRARRGQLLLVRPDGYLACRAPLNRPDIPEHYLQKLTIRSSVSVSQSEANGRTVGLSGASDVESDSAKCRGDASGRR